MLIFGNIVSMIGCVLMVLIGLVRKKERILTLQCFQFGFLAAGNLILGAVSGFISGIVSILRNLIFPRTKHPLVLKFVFIGVQLVLTLVAGWDGLISLLPLLAAILFTWFIDAKKETQLKIAIMVAQMIWAVYDWHYRNYAALTFDFLTILSNAAGIFLVIREEYAKKAPLN